MAMGMNQTLVKARVSTKSRGQGIEWAIFIDFEVPDNDSRNNDRGVSDLGANHLMSVGGMHRRWLDNSAIYVGRLL